MSHITFLYRTSPLNLIKLLTIYIKFQYYFTVITHWDSICHGRMEIQMKILMKILQAGLDIKLLAM